MQDESRLADPTIQESEEGSPEDEHHSFIRVRDVNYQYGPDAVALQDVELEIIKGEFVCIVGPSGCGKSTLLSIIGGLLSPSSGDLLIEGESIYGAGGTEKRLLVGYVFQDHRLLPWRTVGENIAFALQGTSIPKANWPSIIKESLALLRISKYIDSWPLNLSGGQRQRVSIARALAVDPLFMLMDEPFSTLDEVTARYMRMELLRLWRQSGRTTVFVTHSIREAVFLADRIFIMTKGPGTLYREVTVTVPRPRDYEDPALTKVEASIIGDVLQKWDEEGESDEG